MIKFIQNIVWKCFIWFDEKLKFPNLKKGGIGIQVGFDMAAPLTSDLFLMYNRVKPRGLVIGIDPDPRNLKVAQHIIHNKNLNIDLIQKAVFSTKGKCELLLGESTSWNQLNNIPVDSTGSYTSDREVVEMDTLDNIVLEKDIDIYKIGHINLTINGSEYEALKGMHEILSKTTDLNLTIIAGRYDESGVIDGRPDYKVITKYLDQYGFKYKFKRIHQFFWWGFVAKTLLNRKWIYGKKNYGVIMAVKGEKKIKWYQSYS